MKWDRVIGNSEAGDIDPVMYIKTLLDLFGCHIDVHKFIKADQQGCFHTHPAYAIRIILKGGYVEEEFEGEYKAWKPGMIGLVAPSYCHRLDRFLKDESVSIWIRGPVIAKTVLKGDGWPKERQDKQADYQSS